MHKILTLAALLAATLTTRALENTSGDYTPTPGNPYYTTVRGQLYASDGAQWYVLRRPQFDAGLMAGAHYGKQERWCRVGGSHITSYARTPSTFRDTTKRPVFAQGSNF